MSDTNPSYRILFSNLLTEAVGKEINEILLKAYEAVQGNEYNFIPLVKEMVTKLTGLLVYYREIANETLPHDEYFEERKSVIINYINNFIEDRLSRGITIPVEVEGVADLSIYHKFLLFNAADNTEITMSCNECIKSSFLDDMISNDDQKDNNKRMVFFTTLLLDIVSLTYRINEKEYLKKRQEHYSVEQRQEYKKELQEQKKYLIEERKIEKENEFFKESYPVIFCELAKIFKLKGETLK